MTSQQLFTAIAEHQVDAVLGALHQGADPNALQVDWPRWAPLHAAVEELEHGGPLDLLVVLLRHGADPDSWDGQHDTTPLLMACLRERWEAVPLFAARAAAVDVIGGEGDTPLAAAAVAGRTDVVRLLVRCGVGDTLNRPVGTEGLTPLGLAARRLDLETIQVLLAAGADTEATDADQRTPRDRMPERPTGETDRWKAVATALGRMP